MGCGVSKDSCVIDPLSMEEEIGNATANEKQKQKQKQKKRSSGVHVMDACRERVEVAMMHLGGCRRTMAMASCAEGPTTATCPGHSARAPIDHPSMPCVYLLGHDIQKPSNNSNATHIDEGIENIVQGNCEEHGWKSKREYSDDLSTSSPLNLDFSGSPHDACNMRELLEHCDKSTEPLHMPTILEMGAWQSKLFETLDRDIDNMVLDDNVDALTTSLENDFDGELDKYSLAIDNNRYENIEL